MHIFGASHYFLSYIYIKQAYPFKVISCCVCIFYPNMMICFVSNMAHMPRMTIPMEMSLDVLHTTARMKKRINKIYLKGNLIKVMSVNSI